MRIRIKNLRLQTIIGTNDWERQTKQEVVINLTLDIDNETAVQSDDLADSVNYKDLKLKIKEAVEQANFFLLEKLAGHILDIAMTDKKVARAAVEIDKPKALRFADSVSLELTRKRK